MTLKPYRPEDLDQLALQLLDLAHVVRDMARVAREEQIEELPLNDKKAREWYARLEQWAIRAHADLDAQVRIARATRRAQSAAES